MGRNTSSSTQLAKNIVARLVPLSEMFSPTKRRILEKFCDDILQQRAAISEATDIHPGEAALFVLLTEEHIRNSREIASLWGQIAQLRDAIDSLTLLMMNDDVE